MKADLNVTFYKEERFKETPIGKIPEDWEFARLEKICEKVKAGGTPLTSRKEFWNGKIPFVKIEDITLAGKYLAKTNTFISEDGLKNSSAWMVPEKSLLLAMYGSLGEISINKIPVATNQAILGIIPKNREDIEFLYYWYLFFKPNWRKYAKPTTQANLTAHIVRNSVIPLPSPLERKAIAHVLSTVDEAIQKTNEIIEKTERLKKGLMQELLTKGIGHKEFKDTEIGRIPKEWKVVRLRDLANISSGNIAPQEAVYFKDGKYPFIRVQHLNELEEQKYPIKYDLINDLAISNLKLKEFKKGSIIFPKSGESIKLEKRAILKEDSYVVNHLAVIEPISENVNNLYLFYYMCTIRTSNYLTKTTMPSLNLSTIQKLLIPLPPLVEQQKISEILSTVDKKLEIERKRKEKLERIKKALMDLLLTGKIRVKI